MKKLMVISVVFCLMVAIGAGAKSKTAASNDQPVTGWVSETTCATQPGARAVVSWFRSHPAGAGQPCVRKCIAQGAAPVIITDGGNKVLKVENPEAVKGHEGHHVRVTGHTDAAKGTIHVAELKMLGTASQGKASNRK